MFGNYSVSINDRLRILNLLNLTEFVSKMGDNDVLFIEVPMNDFPNSLVTIEIQTADEIRNSETCTSSFDSIYNERTKETAILHINYNTGYSQISTFNIPKQFLENPKTVLGELQEETNFYNTEKVTKLGKEIIEDNPETYEKVVNKRKDNECTFIEGSLFGKVTLSNIDREFLKGILNKRFVNVNLEKPCTVFVLRDGYRYHGVNL